MLLISSKSETITSDSFSQLCKSIDNTANDTHIKSIHCQPTSQEIFEIRSFLTEQCAFKKTVVLGTPCILQTILKESSMNEAEIRN